MQLHIKLVKEKGLQWIHLCDKVTQQQQLHWQQQQQEDNGLAIICN